MSEDKEKTWCGGWDGESESESEVAQSCPTHDPMDCSLPGSSIHGFFQARVLEWGAIVGWGRNYLIRLEFAAHP